MRRLNTILLFSLLAACADDNTVVEQDVDAGADTGLTLACNGAFVEQTVMSANHVSPPEVIEYADFPPAGGNHRPFWGRWGEYASVGPEVYVHNLEHGGMALLYPPDAPPDDVQTLREWARLQDAQNGGTFRWILTPLEGLQTPFAAVTWGWVYSADCVDVDGLNAFRDAHYRKAPEDVGSDGAFSDNYIGRL